MRQFVHPALYGVPGRAKVGPDEVAGKARLRTHGDVSVVEHGDKLSGRHQSLTERLNVPVFPLAVIKRGK